MKNHGQRVNSYCAMFVLSCQQNDFSLCIAKYARSSLIAERHSRSGSRGRQISRATEVKIAYYLI
jgi:hypothetical protein